MGQVDLPQVEPKGTRSLEEYVSYLANVIAIQQEEIANLLGGRISSDNVREIAGYNVSQTELKHKSGIVGMSGALPTTPTAVRFWAGNADPAAAPFRVQQDGKMNATDGEFTGTVTGSTITGGTVRTAASGARVELSGNSLKTYNDLNELNGQVMGDAAVGGSFGDVLFYYKDLATFGITNTLSGGWSIEPLNGKSLRVGASGLDTFLLGNVMMSGHLTPIGSLSQADSTATTIPGIVADFNLLLAKLRQMGILN